MCGSEIRALNTDERSVAGLIRSSLKKEAKKGEWTKSNSGVYVSKASFAAVLDEVTENGWSLIHLRESGTDIREFDFPEKPCFILGDNTDLDESEEKVLESHPYSKVCVGPRSYHADHCITIVNNELDRRSV